MDVITSVDTTSSVSGNLEYLMENSAKEKTLHDVYEIISGSSDKFFEYAKSNSLKVTQAVDAIISSNKFLSEIHSSLIGGNNVQQIEIKSDSNASGLIMAINKIASLTNTNFETASVGLDKIGMSLDKVLNKDFSRSEKMMSSVEAITTGMNKFSASIPNGKIIGGMAMGIAGLGIAIYGFISLITFEDIIKLGLVFTGLALASSLLGDAKMDLLKMSLGIATLGLSIWAFNKFVDFEAVATFGLTFIGLAGAIRLYDAVAGTSTARVSTSLITIAGAVAILGVGLLAYNYVEWSSIAKAVATMTGFGLASNFLKAVSPKDALGIGALAIAVGVMGLALMPFSSITMEDVGVAMLAMGGVAILAGLIGGLGSTAIIGAVALGAVGLSMVAVSYGLEKVRGVNLTLDDAVEIASIIGGTALAVSALSLIAVPIGIGAIAMGVLGGGILAITTGLYAVSTVKLNLKQAQDFGKSIGYMKDAFVNLGTDGTGALAVGLLQSALITGATLPLLLAVGMMSMLKVPKQEVVTGFNNTIQALKGTFTSFGLIELAEIAVTTPAMLLMAGAVVAIGAGINLFTKLSTDKDAVSNSVLTLDTFLASIKKTFTGSSVEEFEQIAVGIDATMNLGLMMSNLADGISKMDAHIKNKVDFDSIGKGIASMISALTTPLATIGGKQDEVELFGFKITNPFSNKVKNGIDALMGIGDVFTPLANIISVFAKNQDTNIVEDFKTNVTGIFGVLGDVFTSFDSTFDETDNSEDMYKYTQNATKFINAVSNGKYEGAMKGFSSIAQSSTSMKNAINEMDLTRLSKLSDLFENFKHLKDIGDLEDLLEALGGFIEKLNAGKIMASAMGGSTDSGDSKKVSLVDKVAKMEKSDGKGTSSGGGNLAKVFAMGNDEVTKSIDSLLEFLEGGNLKVKMKNGNF